MRGIFKIVGHSADTKTISVKFNRLHSQSSINDCKTLNVDYSRIHFAKKIVCGRSVLRVVGVRTSTVTDVSTTRRSVCDSHYHFFCSFVSWKFRFFPKKSAIFREYSKKNIAHFEYFRKLLHFGKIPKKFGYIWRKFSKILAKFAKFWKKTRKKLAIFNEYFEISADTLFYRNKFIYHQQLPFRLSGNQQQNQQHRLELFFCHRV